MATGSAWNETNPLKPFALFDRNAIRDIPITITDWLTDLGTTYASHQVIAAAPLSCQSSSHSSGVITVRILLPTPADAKLGTKYPFTLRLVGADGQQDDMTLWLKMAEL